MLQPMQRILLRTPFLCVRRRFCTSEGPFSSTDVLWAVPRPAAGTTVAKKERAQGRVPGVVFEQKDGQVGGNKRLISANLKQIERLLHKLGRSFFLSRTFTLEIFSHSKGVDPAFREIVLPRTVHLHAGTGNLLNITFIKASPHSRLRVNVPLLFLGEDVCPGLKKGDFLHSGLCICCWHLMVGDPVGGYLNTIRRTACYDCPSEAIPQFLEVDLTGLDIGCTVLLKDIPVHPELKLHASEDNWPVCKIMGSRHVEASRNV